MFNGGCAPTTKEKGMRFLGSLLEALLIVWVAAQSVVLVLLLVELLPSLLARAF